MPNDSSKRLPKYRKHKRSGNALVVLNGREIYLGKHGSAASIEKHNRLIAEWVQSGRQSCDSANEITVVELIIAYLDFANIGPAHLKMATSCLDGPSALIEMMTVLQNVDGLTIKAVQVEESP